MGKLSGCGRWRLGIVGLFLAGLAVYAFLGQTRSQAEPAPFQPALAAFQAKDRLLVGVALETSARLLQGSLQVQLVNAEGRVVHQARQGVRQKEALVGIRTFWSWITSRRPVWPPLSSS